MRALACLIHLRSGPSSWRPEHKLRPTILVSRSASKSGTDQQRQHYRQRRRRCDTSEQPTWMLSKLCLTDHLARRSGLRLGFAFSASAIAPNGSGW